MWVRGTGDGMEWRGWETHGECNNTLSIPQPTQPLLLTNRHTIQAIDFNALKRIIIREANHDLHHQLIDFISGENLLRSLRDFDDKVFFVFRGGFLVSGPLLNFVECVFYDERGEEFARPGIDCEACLTGIARKEPGADEAGRVVETEVVEVYEEPVHTSFWGFRVVGFPHVVVSDHGVVYSGTFEIEGVGV